MKFITINEPNCLTDISTIEWVNDLLNLLLSFYFNDKYTKCNANFLKILQT